MKKVVSKSISWFRWNNDHDRFPLDRARSLALLIAILLGSFVFTGCIIIPVDYHAAGSRRNITLNSTHLLQTGSMSREDVLCTLGEPDFVSEDGERFGYFWSKVKLIWAIAGYGGGIGGEVRRSYLIETSFDPCDRLTAVRLLKRWGDTVKDSPEAVTVERDQGDHRNP